MSEHSREAGPWGPDASARPSAELFCIHSYAGAAGPRCGWRGHAAAAVRDPSTGLRRCPRCGRATLLELPRSAE